MSAELRREASERRRATLRRQPLPDGVTQEAPVHLTVEQRERFRGDLDDLVREAEQLLRRAGGRQTQQPADVRNGLRATLRQARSTSLAFDPSLANQAGAVGLSLHDYVREEPYIAMAVAGTLGALVGWLISKR